MKARRSLSIALLTVSTLSLIACGHDEPTLADNASPGLKKARDASRQARRDLASAALACARRDDRDGVQRRLEAGWSPAGDALACYSVRGGFELLLRALALPPGSEILYSAINIAGMIKAAARHDLVAVPVDLDVSHAAPRIDALERAGGNKSKAARLLGITRRALYGRLERYGIDADG